MADGWCRGPPQGSTWRFGGEAESIGEKFVARFPLESRGVAATRRWLESEAQAARELSGRTRLPTPEPVALGEPGAGYPIPWSVQTWLPGVAATDEDPGESVTFAHDLAEFIRGGREIDTRGRAFHGSGRGRIVHRTIWTAPADVVTFPAAAQVFRIRRDTFSHDGTRLSKEVVHGVTSLDTTTADPVTLAGLIRRHWAIENRSHWVRDVVFGEDTQHAYAGTGAHAMATLRIL